jgi:Methylamine utilisation protein MauE
MKIKNTLNVISAFFIFLFVYTALSKLFDIKLFQGSLIKSPLLKDYSSIISWAVPITELMISIFLFFPKTRIMGLWFTFFLMLSFTIYVAYMILFIADLPCSCGGLIRYLTWQQHLILNTALAAIAIAIAIASIFLARVIRRRDLIKKQNVN